MCQGRCHQDDEAGKAENGVHFAREYQAIIHHTYRLEGELWLNACTFSAPRDIIETLLHVAVHISQGCVLRPAL